MTDSVQNDVAVMLMKRYRFAAEKMPERGVRVLHVEHVAATGFSRCACGKETTPWWHRLAPRFLTAALDALTGQPFGAFELCDRCMRSADVGVWLRDSLGFQDEIITTDDEGSTYQWKDEIGAATCLFHHTGWTAAEKSEEAVIQGDLFECAGEDAGAGEDVDVQLDDAGEGGEE